MTDPKRKPEPSFGPDEEGELPLSPAGITDDPGAWVHVDDSDMTPRADDQ